MRNDTAEQIKTVRVVRDEPEPEMIHVPVIVREETIEREIHFVKVERTADDER